jgi:hypothetical protein
MVTPAPQPVNIPPEIRSTVARVWRFLLVLPGRHDALWTGVE